MIRKSGNRFSEKIMRRDKHLEIHHGPTSLASDPRRRQAIAGQGRRQMMPDLTRRRFISGGASLGALTLLTGCDVTDSFSAEEMLKQVSKFNDGVQAAIFNPNAHGADLPGKRHHQAVPVQRLLRARRRARHRRQGLEARGARPRRQQEVMDAGGALQAAAGQAGDAPYLRRGLERDRKLDRHAAARFPQTGRRRHPRQILSGSSAPMRKATIRRSTWPPRCIRRPR